MTRKQLPKAINRPADNVHAFSSAIVTDEVAPEPPQRPAPSFNRIEEELAVSSAPIANDAAPAANAGAGVKSSATPAAKPEASTGMSSDLPPRLAAKRRVIARRIVERHRTYAAVGGMVPVPVANIASVTAVNLRMVQ